MGIFRPFKFRTVKNNSKNTKTSKDSRATNTSRNTSTTKNDKTVKNKKTVPVGRTLSTKDNFLPNNTGSKKERPVVVIETNVSNELAVVPLSSRKGKNRTRLPNYQKGESYFKHFVEVQDNEGNPIKINNKFKANHKNQDVSKKDVETIREKIFLHSKTSQTNNEKMKNFRKIKNPQD